MLSRLIALPLQIVIAWLSVPYIIAFIPIAGTWSLLASAVIFGVLVWLVGVLTAEALQADLPPAGSLVAAVSLAMLGAGLISALPMALPGADPLLRTIPDHVYPLAGALLGYQIGRGVEASRPMA